MPVIFARRPTQNCSFDIAFSLVIFGFMCLDDSIWLLPKAPSTYYDITFEIFVSTPSPHPLVINCHFCWPPQNPPCAFIVFGKNPPCAIIRSCTFIRIWDFLGFFWIFWAFFSILWTFFPKFPKLFSYVLYFSSFLCQLIHFPGFYSVW